MRAAAAAGGVVVRINAALVVVMMHLRDAALWLVTLTTARRRASRSRSSGSVGWRGCLRMVGVVVGGGVVGWRRQQLMLTFAWAGAAYPFAARK